MEGVRCHWDTSPGGPDKTLARLRMAEHPPRATTEDQRPKETNLRQWMPPNPPPIQPPRLLRGVHQTTLDVVSPPSAPAARAPICARGRDVGGVCRRKTFRRVWPTDGSATVQRAKICSLRTSSKRDGRFADGARAIRHQSSHRRRLFAKGKDGRSVSRARRPKVRSQTDSSTNWTLTRADLYWDPADGAAQMPQRP